MKRVSIASLLLAGLSTAAHAQSNVTIFGSIDDGISYVNNVQGHASTSLVDNINKFNALGFKGTEDIGGGTHALFMLESGFSVNNGAAAEGGLLFGKQAYVGLGNDAIGNLTIGRQYDFATTMWQYLPCLSCGIYGVQNGDLDRISGERLNNDVQFLSRNFGGLTAGVQYSTGATTGSTTTNTGRAIGATVQYAHGDFSVGSYLTDINGAPIFAGLTGAAEMLGHPLLPTTGFYADNQRIVGVGAAYKFGPWRAAAVYTNTRLELGSRSAQDQVLHVGGDYHLTPNLMLATKLSYDKLDASHWITASGGVEYMFSKRTKVYLDLHAQHAYGKGAVASIALTGGSSTDQQSVSRIGITHYF